MQRQAANAKRKAFGEDSAAYASALDNLAATLCNLSSYAEAEKVLTQAHNLRRRIYGDNHPETVAGAKSLAAVRKRIDQPPNTSPMRGQERPASPQRTLVSLDAVRTAAAASMTASSPSMPVATNSAAFSRAAAASNSPAVVNPPSPRPVAEPQPTPYKCGWLTKRGNGVKTWKRRWFVLRNDILNYMEHETAGEPKGSIPMSSVLAVEPGDKKPFCLALVTAPRTYYIVCKDHAELSEWLAVLKSVVARVGRNASAAAAARVSPQRSPRP